MTNVLVSIALCTYNGEKYLKEQLDSLLAQTYSPIEIVIVDDQSTDGTPALLELYRLKYPNIHVHCNTVNLGFNKNFEKAISYTKGEFVAICDQDDIWSHNKIERLVSKIGDCEVIFSNSEFMNSQGKSLGKKLLENFQLSGNYKTILLENFVTGHTAMLHRTIIESIFPIPEIGFYDWWIGFVAMYGHRVTFIDECLSLYRIHDDSVIQKELSKKKSSLKFNATRQLGIFLTYKSLREEDREFITKLKNALDRSTKLIGDPVFFYLSKNFKLYFPKRAGKNLFSRLNFLRKFMSDSLAT